VFDVYQTDRLTQWKKFRDNLEGSLDPLTDVSILWSQAPIVSGTYLNPKEPSLWPDPWHLVLDGRFDDLAICLGMLYTLQLTQRFMGSQFEIHMSITKNKEPEYFLVVDNKNVLNYEPRIVHSIDVLYSRNTNIVWSCNRLP
jgi:hypothetical protein